MDRRTLCKACETCPEVVLEGNSIRVSETIIDKATWNSLIDAIKAGRLSRV